MSWSPSFSFFPGTLKRELERVGLHPRGAR